MLKKSARNGTAASRSRRGWGRALTLTPAEMLRLRPRFVQRTPDGHLPAPVIHAQVGGHLVTANRLAWALFRGPIPPHSYLRRTCAEPQCCAPEHHDLVQCDPRRVAALALLTAGVPVTTAAEALGLRAAEVRLFARALHTDHRRRARAEMSA